RGVNRQAIFFDDDDRNRFVQAMEKYSGETHTDIITYCLMTTHVHILLNTPDQLGLFMKKLSSSYVYYFNHKYDRIGHLFQDRYKSEAVESEEYLLTAARYILQNPQKAHICNTEDYRWSNWNDVVSMSGFTKPGILYEIAGKELPLKEFLLKENDDICLDEYTPIVLSDQETQKAIRKICGETDPMQISNLPKKARDILLVKMKDAGISIKQIEQYTGIGRNIIYRA
ncbi:MAG: transposase, partial [Anaerolineaceae bacterium]|nr:transposase [Anaerolineaceae bacterium]